MFVGTVALVDQFSTGEVDQIQSGGSASRTVDRRAKPRVNPAYPCMLLTCRG